MSFPDKKPTQCADCPYMLPKQFDRCPLCPERPFPGWDIEADARQFLATYGLKPDGLQELLDDTRADYLRAALAAKP